MDLEPFVASSAVDPFGGAKPRPLRRGKEAPLRVNPEQAQALRPGSRRVDVKGFTPSPRSLSVRLAAAALQPLGR